MGALDRRTYLELLAAGGTTVASGFGLDFEGGDPVPVPVSTADSDPGSTRVRNSSQSTVLVSIAETNTPVRAGEVLEVTARLENRGETAVTRDVHLEVGDDRDRVAGESATVEAGATETVAFEYETYPVERDVVFPITVATGGSTAVRPVGVYAGDGPGVARVRPDEELTVRPGTTVMFEVSSPALTRTGTTEWLLDGEHAGLSMGPWYAAYFYSQWTDYWQYTFESTGTHEVTAAVGGLSDDAETYATTWTVHVASDGIAAPTVEATRPADEVLTPTSGEPTALELDASDPDGDLDRVVWWLHQADVVLGVTDLAGSADTASFSTDGEALRCHTCGVVAWVIDEHGAVTSVNPWWVDDLREGRLTASIVETNDPVHAGDVLEVTVRLTNEGSGTASQDVFLAAGDDRVDATSVTLGPGATETVTLGYETYPVRTTVRFPVTVSTADHATQRTVEVVGTDDAREALSISILETNDPVQAGEYLEVTARVANDGNATVSRDLSLVAGDEQVDRTSVTVEPGASETVVLGYHTYPVERDVAFPVTVATGGVSAQRTVEVSGTD